MRGKCREQPPARFEVPDFDFENRGRRFRKSVVADSASSSCGAISSVERW